MASVVRPTKRQKQDHASTEVFIKPKVSNERRCLDSTRLLPIVERFADTHLACSDDLIKIIAKIRSHRYFLESNDPRQNVTSNLNNDHDKNLSIRKLHGTLILYIGFLLGSYKQTSISKEKWEELLSSFVFCLRDLYISNNGIFSKHNVEEDFNELFVLIPKILLSISSKGFSKIYIFQVKLRQNISMACNQIMKSWLNAPLLKIVLSESTTKMLEFFLISLLKSEDTNTIAEINEKDDSLEFLERLRSLCDEGSESRKLLDVALLVKKSHSLSSCDYLSPRLNIFYWRCVSCAIFSGETKIRRNTEEEIADRAVDSMMTYNTSNNRLLSRQAMACIGEFIQISSYDSQVRLIEFASEIVLRTNPRYDERAAQNFEGNDMDQNLIQTLDCLGFCMKNASTMDYFLQMKGWDKVFDNLIRLAIDDNDKNVTEKAAIILIPILKALVTAAQNQSCLLFTKSTNILLKLLSLQNAWIVGKTLELLYTLLKNPDIRRRLDSSTLSPALINALAILASKNFLVEESKKEKLAQTFSILFDEIRNIHFIARKPSNLAFLVRLANASYCETDQSRVQQISICMIIKLARNPCNQRILAKQPGLLSSLIRFTRMTPEVTQVFTDRSVSRKEMKNRILLIANAL